MDCAAARPLDRSESWLEPLVGARFGVISRSIGRPAECGPLSVSSEIVMLVGAIQLPLQEFSPLAAMSIGRSPSGGRSRHHPGRGSARAALLLALLAVLLAAGCATPVGVERADQQSIHRELTGNVLSTGELSDYTQNVLRLGGIAELAEADPDAALAALHEAVTTGIAGPSAMFAYAELAFKRASEGGGRALYLAAAVYAYAYLFPDGEGEAPSSFDPRYRWAVDLYNLAVTRAFETKDGARVELGSGAYELPFGRLDVTFDPSELVWGELRLTEFAPAVEFEVRGLRNRYRRPGLGAPLAAAAMPLQPLEGFQVTERQRAPVTAVLRIADPRQGLVEGRLHAQPRALHADRSGGDRDRRPRGAARGRADGSARSRARRRADLGHRVPRLSVRRSAADGRPAS